MHNTSKTVFALALALSVTFVGANISPAQPLQKGFNLVEPIELKVENRNDTVGVEAKQPVFSWQLSSGQRNVYQSGYRVLVASSIEDLNRNKGNIWDSGKVFSPEQNHIHFKGKDLTSSSKYFWKVKAWDQKARESKWSLPASWITGILNDSEWSATWITFDPAQSKTQPLFRKPFIIKKKVKKAIANISGLGYYELYLNGSKVGDHVLDPAQTNYEHYALYTSYDVTSQLAENNMVGVMLGDGWYSQDKVWQPKVLPYGDPLLICQINIEFTDGSKAMLNSDESWQWKDGPVVESNVYSGETYDARQETTNWSSYGSSGEGWKPVVKAVNHPPKLRAQSLPPIKRVVELPTISVDDRGENRYIFDFGQNFAGWVRLKVNAERGTKIQLRFAEVLTERGDLEMASAGGYATKVEQTLDYICKGDGIEIWEPRFTYHGFRYAEVVGLTNKPDRDLLTGIVVNSAVKQVGTFACSEDQINRLHRMAKWSLTSNLHGVPTDCPTREKCGWIGDAHVKGVMSIYNYDMEAFWIKHLYDIRSSARNAVVWPFANRNKEVPSRTGLKPAGIPFQIAPGRRTSQVASVDWGTTVVQLPSDLYLYYGNREILEEFYPDMKRWVEYCREYLVKDDNIIYEGLGDWGPPTGVRECPIELTSTAFHYLDLTLIADAARILNKPEDYKKYTALSEKTKVAFIGKFFDEDKKSFGNQTADSVALDFGLTPENEAKNVSDAIVKDINTNHDGFVNTGIFGLQRIFGALSNYGNEDVAYQLLTKKGSNSFEQMWTEYGATTLWEILPIKDFYKDKRRRHSRNHPMQSGYDAFFYNGILGIKPDKDNPGFKNIIFRPELTENLAWAKGSYNSKYGEIKSDWRNEKDAFIWNIEIPANTTGVVYLPFSQSGAITESGKSILGASGIRVMEAKGGETAVRILSGSYQFRVAKGK